MIKELIKLASELDQRGLAEEADALDVLIQKLAGEAATHKCFASGFNMFGQVSIRIECVKVPERVIKEAIGFTSKDSKDPVADAKLKIAEWKQKYTGAKWRWEWTEESPGAQPPVTAEDLGLTAEDLRE